MVTDRVFSLLLLIAALATPSLLTPPASAGDWPRYLGATGDGKSTETGLGLEWPESGPPVLWQVAAGSGYGMASIADGRLYLFDRVDDSERLRCLDAATGKQLWSTGSPTDYEDTYEFSDGPRSAPLVEGDRVYTYGAGGQLTCRRTRDGELVWQVDTVKRFGVVQNFFGVGSSPVVEGDLLIVMVGGSPKGSPKVSSGDVVGDGSAIVAFDKLTGKMRYKTIDDLASYSTPVMATIGDRRWGFAFLRSGLSAFEPGTGKVDFHFPWRAPKLESVNASNPLVIGNRVLISECYKLGSALLEVAPGGFEVVRKDPRARRDQSLKLHWMTPVYHDGYVYASSGYQSGEAELRAVEFATGKVAWSERGFGRATLIYADGHLIVLTESGRLLVVRATPDRYELVSDVTMVDAESGKKLIGKPSWSPPALADGRLFVRGKGRLVALDVRRSKKQAAASRPAASRSTE